MAVLLSIKPKYVEEMRKGTKKYEFRKTCFRKKPIDKAFVYSTHPVQRIVGYFTIKKIIENDPKCLWDDLKNLSGITKEEFFDYFANKDKGFAIEIQNFEMFDVPIDPKQLNPKFVAPQSFKYIDTIQSGDNFGINLDHLASK